MLSAAPNLTSRPAAPTSSATSGASLCPARSPIHNPRHKWYNLIMLKENNKLARKYSTTRGKKAEIFHSSGYAQAQSGKNLGSAGPGVSFATRQAIEQKRKYVQQYRTARIMQSAYGVAHAQTVEPRTRGGRGALVAADDQPEHNKYGSGRDLSGSRGALQGPKNGPSAPPTPPVRQITTPKR